jgi:hypothetical protein
MNRAGEKSGDGVADDGSEEGEGYGEVGEGVRVSELEICVSSVWVAKLTINLRKQLRTVDSNGY